MTRQTVPAPQGVIDAFAGPATPTARIPVFADLPTDLAPTGYSAVETGYGQSADGAVWVAVRTEMPRVTAEMWDWWFGWHLTESARYKLWHPDAHMYAEVAAERLTGTGRQRYVGAVSYVDEYIGTSLQQLAIAFRDPLAHGFAVPEGQTVVFGRVGSSVAPLDLGWLAHQVRPIEGGCEMRSRFHLGVLAPRIPDPERIVRAIGRGAALDPRDLAIGTDMARDLLVHCGQEMNHLAGFLPELYAEFGG
ncbi:DAPG hydrolase family protein [Nocardia thailandica]